MTDRPEPFGCSDHDCIWLPRNRGGMGTNGGCHCLPLRMSPIERDEVKQKIRWLVEEVERLQGNFRPISEGFYRVNGIYTLGYDARVQVCPMREDGKHELRGLKRFVNFRDNFVEWRYEPTGLTLEQVLESYPYRCWLPDIDARIT